MSYTMHLTDIGAAKRANAEVSGQLIKFATVVLGDVATAHTPQSTAIGNEVWRGPINSILPSPQDPNVAVVETRIPIEAGGFWIREIGFLDQAGDLIALGSIAPQYKPLLSEGQATDMLFKTGVTITNAANVTLQIDPAVIFASRDWVLQILHPYALANALHIVSREIQKFKDYAQDALISKFQGGQVQDGSQEVIMNNYYTSAAFEYLKDAFHPIVFSRTAIRAPGSDHAGISTLYPFVPSAEFRANGLRYNNYSTSQLGNVSASIYDRDGQFIIGAQDVHDLAKAQAGQGAVISFAETTLDANELYYIGFYYQTGSTMTHQHTSSVPQILPYVDHLAATDSSVFGTNGNALPVFVGATSFGQDVDISALDPTDRAPSINLHHAA